MKSLKRKKKQGEAMKEPGFRSGITKTEALPD